MIFRCDKKILFLMAALLASSIYFSLSHLFINGNEVKIIILAILVFFILFNMLSMLKRKVELKDDFIVVNSLLGRKEMRYDEIKDVVFLYLKGRTTLILADDEKFIFISSIMDNFEKIIELLKDKVSEDIKNKLSLFDLKKNNRSRKLLYLFLITAVLFLILFGTYNFLTS